MATDPAIRVTDLGKCYRLRTRTASYRTLRDTIATGAKRLLRGERAGPVDTFWALRALHFEIGRGEVVGIIGANGAGKSTLLKLLSRITAPTTGRIELWGRVSALLEVGTGFHPELTGLENVFLSGTILGMRRAEIKRQLEEIIDFAEIETFLHLPVKRYSSGMRVRLGFAVAAHLQPEILLIDEVLAVGDLQFQKKCLGKIADVADRGRTVVFVSHQLEAVARVCQRTLLLGNGRVLADGPTPDILRRYREQTTGATQSAIPTNSRLERASVTVETVGDRGVDLCVLLHIRTGTVFYGPVIGLELTNAAHVKLLQFNNKHYNQATKLQLTAGVVRIHLRNLALPPGRYALTLYLGDAHGDREVLPGAVSFEVQYPNAYPLDPTTNLLRVSGVDWTFEPQ